MRQKKMMEISFWRFGGLSLLAGLWLLFGSGCATTQKPAQPVAPETFADACNSAINEPETAARVATLLEELTQIVKDRIAYLKTYDKNLDALTSVYATPENEIRDLIADYNDSRTESQERVVEISGEIRSLITVEEWKALNSLQIQELESIMSTVRWL